MAIDRKPQSRIEVELMKTVKNYNAHVDAMGRITLCGVNYRDYNVRVFENGCIIMKPCVLPDSDSISAKALKDMDNAISNFKAGIASPEIDLSDFK